jgi:hypothetical protein
VRMLNKVIAGVAAATTLTLAAGVALADPPAGVTPSASSIVGEGSNTTEYLLDQVAANYDHAHPHGTQIYSFDACQVKGCSGPPVVTKKGCKPIGRAYIDDSPEGITELEANVADGKGHFCIDFARSSRGPTPIDPTDITFVRLALDNVTYASAAKGSNVPGNLTKAQLHSIYSCSVTRRGFTPNTWGALLGGKARKGTRNVAIAPYLPQPPGYAAIVFFFMGVIEVTTPGLCVTRPSTLEENEGVNPIFTSKNAPNILIPYSAGKWIAQAYHSPACATKRCLTVKNQGVFIKCETPTKGQNAYGCDVNGVLGLNDINGTSPIIGKGAKTILNPGFTLAFVSTLYDVVRGTDSVPSYLAKFFGTKGVFCSKPDEAVIKAYGFETTSKCGTTVPG